MNSAIRYAPLLLLLFSIASRSEAEEAFARSTEPSIRTLNEIEASYEKGRLTVFIRMNHPLEPAVLTVENPPRLVLDFPSTVNRVPFKNLPLNTGPVKGIRVSQYRSADPAIARVVFDLGESSGSPKISLEGSSVQVSFLEAGKPADSAVSRPTVKPENRGNTKAQSTVRGNTTPPVRTEAPPAERKSSNRILREIEASHVNGRLTVALKMDRPVEPTVLTVENPPRLVLDFPGTVNRVPFKKLPLNTDSVKSVRVSQYRSADPAVVRVVFDLGKGFGSHRIGLDASSVKVAFLPANAAVENPASRSQARTERMESTSDMQTPGKESRIGVVAGTGAMPRDPGQSTPRLPEGGGTEIRRPEIAEQGTSAEGSGPNSQEKDLAVVSSSAKSGSTIEKPASENSTISSVRSGPRPEPSKSPAPAGSNQAQTEALTRKPSTGTASAKTATDLGKQDPVKADSTASTQRLNEEAASKSTEHHPSSPEKDRDTENKTEKASSARVIQASSASSREVPAINTTRPSAPLQASKSPVRLSLGKTLERIGKSVEQFRENFKSIACTEYVSQTKLGKKETVIYKKDQEFEYMIFTDLLRDGMNVEESRVEKKAKGREKDLPLLVTKGFPTLLLIFHPFYQGSFKYKLIGEETVEGRNLIRIDFKQIKGRRSTSILNLKDKNYPLELEGTAWIDPESYNIQRIKAGLIKPMEAVGLEAFNSDVKYMPMSFTPNSSTYWMPKTATVEVMTKRQHWRNVHQFEDYRLFSISSESEITIP